MVAPDVALPGRSSLSVEARLRRVRDDLTLRLTAWGTASVVGGALAWLVAARTGRPRLRGFARQSVAWGAIDTVIAGIGGAANRRVVPDPVAATASLRRLLLVNVGLDVGYLGIAALLARRPSLRGDAAGVAVQAAALFALDLLHATELIPDEDSSTADSAH